MFSLSATSQSTHKQVEHFTASTMELSKTFIMSHPIHTVISIGVRSVNFCDRFYFISLLIIQVYKDLHLVCEDGFAIVLSVTGTLLSLANCFKLGKFQSFSLLVRAQLFMDR